MCIVIDTCCLARVFDPHNKEHADFSPVFEWIAYGKGRMIYGGTKYKLELRHYSRLLPIVAELSRKRRVIAVADDRVDAIAEKVKAQVSAAEFNDEHLVAIVIVSRCGVVCTVDKAAMGYLKSSKLYSPYKLKKPKIYSSKTNQDLCCDANLTKHC